MELKTEQRGKVTIVAISGSVDGLTADALMQAMDQHVRDGNTRLVADFTGVNYTSSAGLRALLATMKQARQRGGDLRLAAVQSDVKRVLDLSGFTSILKLYPDVASAVGSFPEA
jgi:anti-anti-sigma factor